MSEYAYRLYVAGTLKLPGVVFTRQTDRDPVPGLKLPSTNELKQKYSEMATAVGQESIAFLGGETPPRYKPKKRVKPNPSPIITHKKEEPMYVPALEEGILNLQSAIDFLKAENVRSKVIIIQLHDGTEFPLTVSLPANVANIKIEDK